MGNRDRKDDLEFSSEELSDLEQSLENRSRITPQGRTRKRTYRRGLRVPSDVVPRRKKAPEMAFELGPKPPPRKPSSKTLPMMEPVSAPPVLQVGPPPTAVVGVDAVTKSTNPTPIDQQSINQGGDPEDLPTEPFLGAASALGQHRQRPAEDKTLPLDLTALSNPMPDQDTLAGNGPPPGPEDAVAPPTVLDPAALPADRQGEEQVASTEIGRGEDARGAAAEAVQSGPEQSQQGPSSPKPDLEDAPTEIDLHPPIAAKGAREDPTEEIAAATPSEVAEVAGAPQDQAAESAEAPQDQAAEPAEAPQDQAAEPAEAPQDEAADGSEEEVMAPSEAPEEAAAAEAAGEESAEAAATSQEEAFASVAESAPAAGTEAAEQSDASPTGGLATRDSTEISLDVAKEAVKLALESATELQVILPVQGGSISEFDFDAPTSPGSSKAMEELGGNPRPEEEGERANRVAILLSALNSPAVEKKLKGEASAPPAEGDVPAQPTLQRLPSEDITLDFEAPEERGSGEVEELSTEELEEVSGENFVAEEDVDASMSPPPIPEGPLSPFEAKDDVPEATVSVLVSEDADAVMTSAPPDPGSAVGDRPTVPETALEATQPLPRQVEETPPPAPAPAAPAPAQRAAAPVSASPAGGVPIPALARGRKRKKTWFEEIFDEDWLRTIPGRTPKFTSKEVDFLEESLQPSHESQLLDLGCGDGRHTIELASRGFQVTGYDLSLPLLIRAADEAQRRNLQANFVHGDFRDLSFIEQFDAIFCLGSSFGFFDDDSNRRMIQAVNSSLRVGGRFLLDVVNRDYLIEDLPSRIWWEGEGCVILEEVDFNFFTSRIISKRSVVFEDGRHLEQEISVRSYSLHELGKILHHAGFRVLEVTGNIAHRTRYFGNNSRSLLLLAEKRPQ